MSATCPSCKGSGELLRGTGIYDCAAPDCTAAVDRTALEDSLPAAALGHPLDTLWIGYQMGKDTARPDFGASKPFHYRSTAQCVLRNELAIIIGCQDGRSSQDKADAVLRWIEKNYTPEK